MQTSLKNDQFCMYNQEAAQFYWIFQDGQYNNTYQWGEVSINAAGGTGGSYVRPDVIDVSSFLSGRDEILSKCSPPVPSLDDVEQQPLVMQNSDQINLLISKDTREKRSAIDLSSIDYNRWMPNLPSDPQNLRFVIEDFAPQRGGLNTTNYTKLAWNPTVARGAAVNGNPAMFQTVMDPQRFCGQFCDTVSGYNSFAPGMMAGGYAERPQKDYPFAGITTQQVKAVGAAECGPQQFWGPNYTEGSCGRAPQQTVLTEGSLDRMAQMAYTSL